jgi:serine/threonine protein kinase/tetratricopeptide (TPR) repeat protein
MPEQRKTPEFDSYDDPEDDSSENPSNRRGVFARSIALRAINPFREAAVTDLNALESLYFAALEKPAAQRAVFLDAACGADLDLRARVERLLAAHPKVGGFLDGPAVTADLPAEPSTATFDSDGSATSDLPGRDERVGAMVGGKYKLIEGIGEGGMGQVFLAQQTEPVKRIVAVKVIKAGMDSRAVLARFEAERQALAMMDHPNIARVLDAGATESGRPFFVMELVRGVPITQFCDERKLTPHQRLELFVPVCNAIQHAHQKGVIHRDIKPSNVLVAMYDDRPVPKVIDFGVAKAAGQTLTDKTLITGFGAVVGTPEYMSPEQANLNNLDIDTRSDIYSLGVLLYELLTGTTPVDRKSLGKAAILEILRIVREVEAPKPSAKLSTIDALPTVAANRGTEPSKLSKLIKGELDWVVLKALEKDRTRRYDTINAFARDIQRYLADEIVEARPPSTGYRLKKLVRRHKGQVTAASLVLVALLAGIIGTSVGLVQANASAKKERDANDVAQAAKTEAEIAAKSEEAAKVEAQNAAIREKGANEKTRRSLAQLEKGVEQFAGLLKGINPREEELGGPTVYEQLRQRAEKAADALDADAFADPLATARLQMIFGDTLRGLGNAGKAAELLVKARLTRERELGPSHPDTLAALESLAAAYYEAGKTTQAIELYERVRDARMKKPGPDHPDTLDALAGLALAYNAAGKSTQAIELLEQIRDTRLKKLGPDHPDSLATLGMLAVAYEAAGKTMQAIELYERARNARVKKLGPDHPETLAAVNNLAVGYMSAGKTMQAIELLERVRDVQLQKLGPNHPETLFTLGNLASAYQKIGKMALAVELYEQVRAPLTKKLGADHPKALAAIHNLALAYLAVGKSALAVELLEQSRNAVAKKLGPDHPDTLLAIANLAGAYLKVGKTMRAIELLEYARDAQVEKLGAEHPQTISTIDQLAAAYNAAGRMTKALELLELARDARLRKLGPDHPETLATFARLASAYQTAGKLDEALQLFEETLARMKGTFGLDHAHTLTCMNELGDCYRLVGKLDKAVPLLEETLKIRKAKFDPDHPDTLVSMSNLALAYQAAGKLELSIPLSERTLALLRASSGPDLSLTLTIMNNLAVAYQAAGKLDKAVPLLEEALSIRKAKFDPDHPDTLIVMCNLAANYAYLKQPDRAVRLFQEVLKAQEKQFGRQHPTTLAILNNLGVLYLRSGRPAEAIPLLEEVFQASKKFPPARESLGALLESYAKAGETDKYESLWREQLADAHRTFPKDSQQLGGVLATIGWSLLEQQQWADSEAVLRECLPIRQKTQPDAWTTFNTQSQLGGALLAQKKYVEAKPLLLVGYEGLKQREKTIPPQSGGDLRIPQALDRLIELYTATDKPDEAKKWRVERAKYPPAPLPMAPQPREK